MAEPRVRCCPKAGVSLAFGLLVIPLWGWAELPGDEPRLAAPRIEQADIESGRLNLREIRLAGMRMFSTPFNRADGYGDGPMDPFDTTEPGGRPTLQGNGTFLRINGLDGQACFECHSIVSNDHVPAILGIGGVGGSVTNVMFKPRFLDVNDSLGVGHADTDGRFINPLFLFGSGGVELLAREMTADLRALRDHAQANPGTTVELVTKGVGFGVLRFDGVEPDLSGLQGIDHDLVVRPFGRKGEFATVRSFDEVAMMFHFGMQPVETVGADVDGDGDGVVNEVLVGELSALAVFNTTLEHPTEAPGDRSSRLGRELFEDIGCAACHVPRLETRTRFLDHRYPEDPLDPEANVYLSVDLSRAPASFARAAGGGVVVPLYADLKRHDLGPALAESTGSTVDRMFTTARLWGVADTGPYLHDGRALSLNEAILWHGGEAQAARDQYAGLSETEQAGLISFLMTLRTPRQPAADLQPTRRR